MFPLKFRAEVKREETKIMGLSSSEDPMIVAWVVLTQCQSVQTDGQTDGFTVANYSTLHSRLCWRAVKMLMLAVSADKCPAIKQLL